MVGEELRKFEIHYKMQEADQIDPRLDEVQAAPPADTSWRYRKDGAPKAFAIVGVAVGFVFLIVPGLIALRSYRRWQEGIGGQPTFAWSMAILGGLALVVVPLFQALPVVAVAIAIVVGVPLLAFVAPRR
jgi:hypothetical protein